MNPRILIRPRADLDADECTEANARHSLSAARRFQQALEEALRKLAAMPEMGALCEFNNPAVADLRVWSMRGFEKHLIFYRPLEGGVEVVRVIYGSRDFQAFFEAT